MKVFDNETPLQSCNGKFRFLGNSNKVTLGKSSWTFGLNEIKDNHRKLQIKKGTSK